MLFVVSEKIVNNGSNDCLDLHFHAYVVRFFDLPGDDLESIVSVCGGELIS